MAVSTDPAGPTDRVFTAMSGVNEIRSTFLDYFAKAGHEVLPS